MYTKISKKILTILLTISLVTLTILPTTKAYAADKESIQTQLSEQTAVLEEASNAYWEATQKQQEAQQAVDTAEANIIETTAQIETNTNKLSTRANNMYRNGNTGILEMVLGCTTFTELVNTVEILNRLNSADAQMIKENKELRAELENQKIILNENLATAKEQADNAYSIKTNAEAVQSDLQNQLNQLEAAEKEAVLASNRGGGNSSHTPQPYVPATGNAIVDRALSQCGVPYVWGGCSPSGFDCSGLVSYALTGRYTRIGTAATFYNMSAVDNPQPGDVICTSGHCGIYMGGNQMVHAPQTGDVVRVSSTDWFLAQGAKFVRY